MKQTLAKESHDKKLGFTLIEIMLVIAVIGILAIVSVPKYQGITEHYQLEASAQTVIGQLRYAKQLAMDQRKKIYLAVDTTTVEVLDATGNGYGGVQALDRRVIFDRLTATSYGLIESGKANGLPHVVYDARGFVENTGIGGAVRIILSSVSTGRSVDIVVELQTGNITVEW